MVLQRHSGALSIVRGSNASMVSLVLIYKGTSLDNGNGYGGFKIELLHDTGWSDVCSLWYPSKTFVVV